MSDKVALVTCDTPFEEWLERFNTQAVKSYIDHAGGDFTRFVLEHEAYRRSLESARRSVKVGLKMVIRRALLAIIGALLRFLGILFSPLYAVSFGLLDKHMARKHERQLAADVHFALSSVFSEHVIRIVPNQGGPFPPGFDYAFVTASVDNLLLRFTRGRGELGVLIAPTFAPLDWHDLSFVLSGIESENALQRGEFRDVWHAARSLQPHLHTMMAMFSVERFSELKR